MKVTVRNPQFAVRDRYFYPVPEYHEYEGEETTLKHIDSNQYLCLTTGLADFKVRIIDRSMIVNSEPQKLFILDEFFGVTERRTVKGSKGNTYELTKTNGKWTCTCPGFEYRKDCKHVRAA